MEHRLVMRTEVLDQTSKAVMQAFTATKARYKRLGAGSKAARNASEELNLLAEAMQDLTKAQLEEVWAET